MTNPKRHTELRCGASRTIGGRLTACEGSVTYPGQGLCGDCRHALLVGVLADDTERGEHEKGPGK